MFANIKFINDVKYCTDHDDNLSSLKIELHEFALIIFNFDLNFYN
jgi:hypothetical protein